MTSRLPLNLTWHWNECHTCLYIQIATIELHMPHLIWKSLPSTFHMEGDKIVPIYKKGTKNLCKITTLLHFFYPVSPGLRKNQWNISCFFLKTTWEARINLDLNINSSRSTSPCQSILTYINLLTKALKTFSLFSDISRYDTLHKIEVFC